MTRQILDSFKYNGEIFSIIKDWGEGGFRFIPQDYGLYPQNCASSNWCGYHCVFAIRNDILVLKQLNIGLDDINKPDFCGKKPRKCKMGYYAYYGVNLGIDYSGSITIGKEIISENFYRPLSQFDFKVVLKLTFQSGKLIEQEDISPYAEEIRQQINFAVIELKNKIKGTALEQKIMELKNK